MGVTIRYEGRLRSPDSYDELAARVKQVADRHEWLFSAILAKKVHLPRIVDGEVDEYVGPLKGVVVNPHQDCEAVRFLFDATGFMQGFVKTQFCPSRIHIRIVELLRSIEDLFTVFRVVDEGAYWETGRVDMLDQRKKLLANEIEGPAEFLNQARPRNRDDPSGP